MTRLNHTRRLALMEEAVTVLFCLIDDAYAHLKWDEKAEMAPHRLR